MPVPLLAPGDAAASRLACARALFVAADFDGTLAHIVPDPARAVMVPGAAAALGRLAGAPGTAVGLFSGRDLGDLRARVGLAGLCYAGNHGLEMAWEARTWGLSPEDPRRAAVVRDVARLAADLRRLAEEEPGAAVEEKGLSLTLHYRNVPRARRAPFAARALRWLAARGGPFERVEGKSILEVRPAGLPGKEGAFRVALRWAEERLDETPLPLFIGDDANDEPALDVARAAGGLAVAVGDRPSAAASHRLDGPEAVAALLGWLADRRARLLDGAPVP